MGTTRTQIQQEIVARCNKLYFGRIFSHGSYERFCDRAEKLLGQDAQDTIARGDKELDYYRDYLIFILQPDKNGRIFPRLNKPTRPNYLNRGIAKAVDENGKPSFPLLLEIWATVFSYLSFAERMKLRSLCKNFNELIEGLPLENSVFFGDRNFLLLAYAPKFEETFQRAPSYKELINAAKPDEFFSATKSEVIADLERRKKSANPREYMKPIDDMVSYFDIRPDKKVSAALVQGVCSFLVGACILPWFVLLIPNLISHILFIWTIAEAIPLTLMCAGLFSMSFAALALGAFLILASTYSLIMHYRNINEIGAECRRVTGFFDKIENSNLLPAPQEEPAKSAPGLPQCALS